MFVIVWRFTPRPELTDAFRTGFAADYQLLNAQMEHLTLREESVGHFDVVG